MNGVISYIKKMFSTTNVVGYVMGLMGLSIFAVTQFVTALLPLLFAPLVCGTFGVLLYKYQPIDSSQSGFGVGPIPTATQE
ncbi:MAG: hypothetical protein NLN65_05845 [Candidatus Poseidoniaceae archaeon]|nr:hypothetical protein [Candidatus Poseidoniaceae archaeon]|tara:strand:- start:713 stop:955 length:243 start_codon:yes stop_codon:yes gene_type:complete